MFEDFELPTEDDIRQMIETNRVEAIGIARDLYSQFKDSLQKGIVDVIYFEGSLGEKFFGPSWRGMVDRYGQIYMTISLYIGLGVGFGGSGGIKLFGNQDNKMTKIDMESYITGIGGGLSLYGGIGGGIAWGANGGLVEMGLQANISVNGNLGWTTKIYEI